MGSRTRRYSVGYMDVSPDGKWLLYTQPDLEESDIMLVENFR